MKKRILKSTLTAGAASLLAFTPISCKDGNKNEPTAPMSSEKHQEDTEDNDNTRNTNKDKTAEVVLKHYFNLKDALVDDDNEKAKELGNTLSQTLKSFDVSGYSDSQKAELTNLAEDATVHAIQMVESKIDQQRQHFKAVSKNITDMVAITGTEQKLYEQYCPMYDGGAAWLSTEEEVRNPYYGSQMLTCGKVQREID